MARARIIVTFAVIAFVLGIASPAFADRTVRGTVRDDATGLPIAGALVTVGIGETATDENGAFTVGDVPFGRVDVLVIADDYATYFGSARVGAVLSIRLESEANASEVIHVSGNAPSGPPLHLDTQAIRTQPGAGNDVLRALQSLPGAARTPFGMGGLALRGTAPRDTKVYLDGIEVPLLYHFGGLASFLPTSAVDEVTLEPGGASVRYGRGLGGVAIVTSRTGRADRWRTGGEISLIHAGAGRRRSRAVEGQLAHRRATQLLRRDPGRGEPRALARAAATPTRRCAGSPATESGWRSCSAPTTS